MKRWWMGMVGLVVAVVMASSAWAANSSCTVTVTPGKIGKITFVLVSDSATGAVTCAAVKGIMGNLTRVTTKPGTAAPTDSWDFTLLDDDGADTLGGKGTNAGKNAAVFTFKPYNGTADAGPVPVSGGLTLGCTAMGNSKDATVVVYFETP